MRLRVDPGNNIGVFSIQSIGVEWLENESSTCLQTLYPGSLSDTNLLTFQNIEANHAAPETLFYALTQDPYISWQLPENSTYHGNGAMRIEIAMKWLANEPGSSIATPRPNIALDAKFPRRLFSVGKPAFLTSLAERWNSFRN